jgi:hypothetical protein
MNQSLLIGVGAAVLGVLATFLLPVSPRRVNQGIVTLLIASLAFAAAFLLFEMPLSLGIALAASAIAILYRDVMQFVRHLVYDVTKYRRRDFWYRRVGQAVLGGRARRR